IAAPARRQDDIDARIRRRIAKSAIRPCAQIFDGVDDPAADLPVLWTGPIGAVLLERATGEAEEPRRLRRAQVSCGEGAGGGFLGHERASRDGPRAPLGSRAMPATIGEKKR